MRPGRATDELVGLLGNVDGAATATATATAAATASGCGCSRPQAMNWTKQVAECAAGAQVDGAGIVGAIVARFIAF